MKFLSVADKSSFLVEIGRLDLLGNINEEYVPDEELLELFFSKENSLFTSLKNHKKSKSMESVWRHHRYKYMRGIKAFHKSTEGKRFHRELGRFIATHNFEKGFLSSIKNESYHTIYAYLKPFSSIKTQFIISQEYYRPIVESVDLHLTFIDAIVLEKRMSDHFLLGKKLDNDDYDFVLRLVETNAQINAFAEKTGKSKEEIEKMWKAVKQSLIDSGDKEEDPGFYKKLVGIIKKNLGLSGKEASK
jgi:hypothetical protein